MPKKLAEKFITEFHRKATQKYNKITVLVARLQTKYIIRDIWNITKKIVKECPDCQRNKFLKHKLYKKLQPVKVLSGPWKVILWDFITKLLKSKDPIIGQKHNAMLVIINKLTKQEYFIACTEEVSAENVAQIYVKKVFSQHGLLKKIILNKDLKFMATF